MEQTGMMNEASRGQYKLYMKIAFWASRTGNNELSRECERKASELHKFREKVNNSEPIVDLRPLGKMIHEGCRVWTSSAVLERLGMDSETILRLLENPEIADALGKADLKGLELYSRPKTGKKSWFRKLWRSIDG